MKQRKFVSPFMPQANDCGNDGCAYTQKVPFYGSMKKSTVKIDKTVKSVKKVA